MFKTIVLMISFCMSSAIWAKGDPMINDVIQNYFEGYQKAEVELIKKAFHPETRLLSVDEGKMDVTEMADWIKIWRTERPEEISVKVVSSLSPQTPKNMLLR